MLTLILGGARSGKSRLAQHLAMRSRRVVYLATAQPGDDPEMMARIERHRAGRPAWWRTVEEPLELADAVERMADADTILVDCLTVWLGNLFWQFRENPPQQRESAVHTALARIARAARQRHIVLVSNEVGCATIPEAALARDFRDAQGLLNQWAAEAADEVILTVAGLPIYLKTATHGKGSR